MARALAFTVHTLPRLSLPPTIGHIPLLNCARLFSSGLLRLNAVIIRDTHGAPSLGFIVFVAVVTYRYSKVILMYTFGDC